jgi:hypothetical protein
LSLATRTWSGPYVLVSSSSTRRRHSSASSHCLAALYVPASPAGRFALLLCLQSQSRAPR